MPIKTLKVKQYIYWLLLCVVVASAMTKVTAKEKATKPADNQLSLELLEYLAEFSDKDGAIIDPETYQVIQPRNSPKCRAPNKNQTNNATIDEEPPQKLSLAAQAHCLDSQAPGSQHKSSSERSNHDD